jgi:hypothetical protein
MKIGLFRIGDRAGGELLECGRGGVTPPTWPPRWEVFLDAEAKVRWFAFASYVAVLDAEEAAATDLAELASRTGG